jgi:hypothetical protein
VTAIYKSQSAFSWLVGRFPPHLWEGTIYEYANISSSSIIDFRKGEFLGRVEGYLFFVRERPQFTAIFFCLGQASVGGIFREQSTSAYTRRFNRFAYRLIYIINDAYILAKLEPNLIQQIANHGDALVLNK